MTSKKNVLLLIADDLGKQLGCYGNSKIQTPNIDKLAAEGTKFDLAFASTASCSASRSVIYSGLHTHQNGQYGLYNGRHHFTTFDNVKTAPSLFAENGHLTGIIGKVHVGPEDVYPWHVREPSDTRDVAWVADRATAFFDRAGSEGKQFFLTVGYIDPHRDRTRSGFGNDGTFDARVSKAHYQDTDVVVPAFVNDHAGTRFEFAEYYTSINRLDQGIGLILERLDKSGLAQDTMVVFLSDNGPPFINSKTTLYDAGVNLPLIVKCPGECQGVVSTNMVSYIDILPTILDWAGSDPKTYTQDDRRLGRSFLNILSNTQQPPGHWDRVFGSHTFHEITNYWPTRFLRTRRYKYHRNLAWRLDFPFAADIYGSLTWEDIRNDPNKMIGSRPLKDYFFRPPEELYDLQEDPNEVRNLADDHGYTNVLEELRKTLEEWQLRSADPWLYRDGISVLLVKHHLNSGMIMPDRWDLDPENPGSKGPHVHPFANPTFGKEGAFSSADSHQMGS